MLDAAETSVNTTPNEQEALSGRIPQKEKKGTIIVENCPDIAQMKCESPLSYPLGYKQALAQDLLLYENESALRDRAWVEINLTALADNVRQIKQLLSPQTDLMAVVKADAYGHGAIAVAKTALQYGANWLGVATIPEGIELRKAGLDAPILILGATHTPDQIRAIAHWKLQPTLCTAQQALVFSETLRTLNQSLPVHIKLDTGMSRLGTSWQEAADFVQIVSRCPNLQIASIYSHLATADSPDPAVMRQQHQRFEEAIAKIRATGITIPRLHLANSAAALTDSTLHYDMVRVGLGIYGLYPATHLKPEFRRSQSEEATVASNLQAPILKPVLQVKARVTQVKTISPGTGVSYGYQFIADREMPIAVVGIGYADGVPRNLSNKMKVSIRGQLIPQIGAITMDQLMLDVSVIPDLQIGEVVTLLGQDGDNSIQADDWAATLSTISWEILCGFKHRLPRVAVEDSAQLQE